MDFSVILAFASALFAAAVGVACLWQERKSPAHIAFAVGMALLALESFFAAIGADPDSLEQLIQWQNRRLLATALVPGVWLLFSLTFARGNLRQSLTHWRIPLIAIVALPPALAFAFYGRLFADAQQSGVGLAWRLSLTLPGWSFYLLSLAASIAILMNLERTFRASVGTMRWRIKFMILGLATLFGARCYTSSQVLLFHTMTPFLQTVNAAALLLACLLIMRSLSRTSHFQVTVYPSHAVLHKSLTVLIAGAYLLVVGVLAKLLTSLGGDKALGLVSLAVLTLIVALVVMILSEKLQLLTKRFVSRNFQRPLHDYRSVWRRFALDTALRIESDDLCQTVCRLTSEVFQALSVTIWTLNANRQALALAASTSANRLDHSAPRLDPTETQEVISNLRLHPDAIDIDSSREIWAILLRRLHSDEFRKGGNRICVPLIAGNELLGMIMLGDRVGGIPYTLQDLDLLKSLADQTAASLLNITLSQQLTQAKQLEAFQAMSTFFVHDLKNTASTLSLMLQNLPQHFNDPAFRADALRGIGKTVTHINDLIARLTSLRQGLNVRPSETNLNELIAGVLSDLQLKTDAQTDVQLVQHFAPLPKVNADAAQLQSVVTNLLLNARDAVGANGQIKIETARQNGWAVLAVSDNGCGMTPEFVQSSLFRPFQTTKKKGMGIGMFQSRLVVEAHQGKIEVQSQPGKGTSFRILLPLSPQSKISVH